MGELSGSDNAEKKAIAKVAEAHGGVNEQGGKDTIFPLPESVPQGTASFRPRVLAALVRFADEICESRNRAAHVLINRDKLPIKSQVYQIYAKSINSVQVHRNNKSINLKYIIPIGDALRYWGKDNTRTYLTDEILRRLEKMNLERNYCSRFMYPIVMIERIDAAIEFVDENFDTLESHSLRLGDDGYPIDSANLAQLHPNLLGKSLVKRYQKSGK
jgi:hypothetical protein